MYESKSEGMFEMAYYFISPVCKYCIYANVLHPDELQYCIPQCNAFQLTFYFYFILVQNFFFASIIMACFTHHICSAPCKNTVQTLYKSVYECNALQFRSSVELEFSNSEWFKQFTATLWGLRFRLVAFLSCKIDFMMIRTVIVLTHWPLAGWLTN